MATVVVRVVVDPDRRLAPAVYRQGVERLGRRGLPVLAGRSDQLREIEFVVDDQGGGLDTAPLLRACQEVFGLEPRLGVRTHISRGTDEDAHSVLRRFGVFGGARREVVDDEEIVTVSLPAEMWDRVPESRLRTALEAALNAEVRIERATPSS